jgi:hypothetical protein
MKYLITLLIAALSLNAVGQGIPQLPYNPDENGDGLIGVPDLQALLAQYGLEFNSAVLSEDAQSAIVYMGQMAHPVCNLACDNLPGFWHMSTMNDLALVWDEVISSNDEVWINSDKHLTSSENTNVINITAFKYYDPGATVLKAYASPQPSYKCYCAAHELPKVEYSVCHNVNNYTGLSSDFLSCCVAKVEDGWYPLESNPTRSGGNNYTSSQAFWRWAVE